MSEKKELDKRLKPFSARYRVFNFFNTLQYTIFFTAVLCLTYCLADKLVYLDLDTRFGVMLLTLISTTYLLVRFLAGKRNDRYVCYLIDRRSGLKNLVGSGYEAGEDTGPVPRQVAKRAVDELGRRKPGEVIPMQFNWGGRYCLLPLLAVLGVFHLMPDQDLFKRREVAQREEQETVKRKNSAKLISETVQRLEKLQQQVKSIDGKSITLDMETLARDLEDTPSRKEALNKLSSLEKRYREEFNRQRDFEKSTKNLTAELDAHDLNADSKALLTNLAKSLQKNEFRNASAIMRQMADQMRNADLDDKEKKALARELGKLMKQMKGDEAADKLTKSLNKMNQKKPEKSAQAKKNDAAMNKKEKQAQNKNSGQKNSPDQGQNSSQQQAQSKKEGDSECKDGSNIPGIESKLGRKGKPGSGKNAQKQGDGEKGMAKNDTQAADQMDDMANSLDEMDAMNEMQKGLADAKREMVGDEFKDFDMQEMENFLDGEGGCQGRSGNGQGPGGQGKGNGTGGKGQGRGGTPEEQQAKTAMEKQLSPSKQGKGKVLNQTWVYGVPEKGDARKNFSAEVRNAREKAMSSLARNPVPHEYQEMVKDYFSSLEPEKERK